MSDKIVICLLTYNRFDYAERTLRSTLENIITDRLVSVHIASDGDTPEYISRLMDIAGGYERVQGISFTNSERGGYGRNVNLATQVIHDFAAYVLMLEDDWKLIRLLNLDNLVEDMEKQDEGRIECIRLGYLSFTQELRGRVINAGPRDSKYLLFDVDSPEPHVFAGHPRLESVAYQRKVGPWPEGLTPGATEFAVAHNWLAREGVVWPMDLVKPYGDLFAHIGSVRSY